MSKPMEGRVPVTPGTTIILVIWDALRLELPIRRRPQLMRFFVGLKPLLPIAYASLLRAMARAVIEADLVPVRRGARHDPVELIAAALEVSIERWDRLLSSGSASWLVQDGFWYDIATRIAAFEILFGLDVRGEFWEATLAALARALDGHGTAPVLVFDRVRLEVSAMVQSRPEHAEAMLAEIVVVGTPRSVPPNVDPGTPTALPLACGMALIRAERVPEALAVFDGILDRVPGHTLALQQAARCCLECGALARAESYSRRASGRVGRSRGGASAQRDRPRSPTSQMPRLSAIAARHADCPGSPSSR
jgi:hypothetical protein